MGLSARPAVVDRVVIALPDENRLESFRACPGGESFRVFWAVDGRGGRAAERFDTNRFVARVGSPATGGEMGCVLSHLSVVTAFANEVGADTDLMVVAEDDALLGRDFEAVLDRLVRRLRPIGVVVLADPFGAAGRRDFFGASERWAQLSALAVPVGPAHRPLQYRVGRVEGHLMGAGLYLITRRAARRYADWAALQGRPHWVADDYGFWAREARIGVRLVRPNLAGWVGGTQLERPEPGRATEILREHQRSGSLLERLRWRLAPRTRLRRLAASLRAARRRDPS
ncbi:glycosyltransferase family 25 protein [Aestuariimicrobium soli]|uniref:glycosyltransferase family 25 protein n=1 Tax=Aestuariimicrobium soli TaxID=2035834 RepID=UPI003EC08D24